nr:PAS domain-containing protein [Arthrospira sp. PLM2.Bin9]
MKDHNLQGDRLAKLQRHIPGVVYELRQHPDGHFSLPYANDNLGDIYGLSLSDVAVDAQAWFRAIHPEDRPTVLQSLQESATHLCTWHSTHRVRHVDSQCFCVCTHGTPERQLDGGTKWYGYLENVTPLKQAPNQNASKLRRIIENLNDMVFITAPDGTFTFLSPMFETIMGYPLHELLHTCFSSLIHPADLATTMEVFQSVLAGERVQDYEHRVRHADGHYYWHSVNLSPFQEDNGTACLGVSSFIHDRKQAEFALKESQLRLQLALESSNIGLWDWNLQTNEVTFNTNWRTMLGYGEGEVANAVSEWERLVHPEDLQAAYDDINRHLTGETDCYRNEHRLRCKDGSYKWILDQGRVVEWDEVGNPLRFIGTHTDISEQQAALRERKQTELKLHQLTQQLQKAQEVAHLGHWSFDIATQKITWSEEVFRIFSHPFELGEPSFEEHIQQVYPGDRAYFLERIASANQGIPQNFDFRIVRGDGTIRYVNSRIELEFQNEQIVRMFGVVMDITDRVEALQTLRESDAKLRSLFDLCSLGIVLNDMSGQFIEANPAITEMTGYTLEELNQLSYWDLTPAEYGEDEARQLELLNTIGRYGPYEKEYIDKQGHRVPVELNGVLVTGRDGRHYIWSVIADISSRKQAEALKVEQVNRELKLLENVLEVVLAGYWDWDIANNQEYLSPGFKRMLGYEDHELANSPESWQRLIFGEDLTTVFQHFEDHVQSRGKIPFYNEVRYHHKDGSMVWVLCHGRVIEWDAHDNPLRMIGCHIDISDRKQTELKLIELSNQLKKAQEVAQLGHWSCDIATGKITWSEEVFQIFNRPLEQGEPSFEEYVEQVHPEDRALLLERLSAAHQGISQNFDHRILSPDGRICHINARIQLEVEDEQVVRMFGTLMDITDRRVAELELERFFTISLDLLCIADTGGHFRRVSQAWSDVLGYSPADLEGKVFLEFVHPDDLPATLAAISTLGEGQPVIRFTNRYRTKSGSYRHIEWLSLPQGELIYAAARDITERIKAQEQLEALLNRTQLLNALSHEIRQSLELDQIIETAIEAIFNGLNLDICTFARYGEEDGHPYVEIVQEKRNSSCQSWLGIYDATQYPDYHQALLTNQVFTFNRQNPGEDCDRGIYEFCESMGVNLYLMLPIRTSEQLACLEMGRIDSSREWRRDEIELLESLGLQIAIAMQQAHLYQTAQQRTAELQVAYRELQETQVQLVQAEKMSSLGQLVAGIAHEINNPVSFIYGNLDPLGDYVEGLLDIIETYQETYPDPPIELSELIEDLDLLFIAEDLPKMLNSMRNGADRIRDIVKSLRTFSRLDEADLKAADLHENLDSTLMILQNQLNGRSGKPKIEVIKNYGDLPLVECYIGLLNQVFMNVLLNAIQAIESRQNTEVNSSYQGVITITTIPKEAGEVVISVQDNGLGMSEPVKAKIFDPFFTTKPIGSGTGMGLPTSHQIVTKYHQGELYCDSKLGCGTTFFIKFPPLKSVK